ncbi:DUF2986 domain-containing protein [Vibrio metschnikovii]|jgi:hypothetical protein|uniref:DUF2986 domain-containing protein n=5 Tax=Unclassified Bacteria TaxID=49928 RepID=A0AAU6T2E6_UNCXX|nr:MULTISPECIES: DUF2986 domain-containing protein [Vibrio]EEX36085.1 hypothetical protein VIB_002399 [Vibrio metschnikovii CIP 69.14]EKO3556443.1 DUF2986 domain-containing protein [Vibrio metschnikovii]EKO3567299.1 DUF2986 domain-containing protein [Vibrio metschnikovii]EKO3570605.1 DUF2986 domain-containing protein [Vibrio metschnikovii]EKO3575082.1 DUF2986 domain-containing protein [Vibrio metschnikovii]
MNRKKKINQTLQKHLKKKNAKLHGTNKPRYISKAERAKLEAEQAALETVTTDAEQQADNGLQQ